MQALQGADASSSDACHPKAAAALLRPTENIKIPRVANGGRRQYTASSLGRVLPQGWHSGAGSRCKKMTPDTSHPGGQQTGMLILTRGRH